MGDQELKREILETARAMNARGINHGASGNVSARVDQGFLVTPSGRDYDDCTPGDVVTMTMEGAIHGSGKPSSEWRIHRDLLAARPEANAVLHAHPPFATALACLGQAIPAFHYMVAIAGGRNIRCAPYATFGTDDLSRSAVDALQDRKACLLANHGMVAIAPSLSQVLDLAVEVEILAQQYWRALQIGEPNILDDAEMDVVLAKFKDYAKVGNSDGE